MILTLMILVSVATFFQLDTEYNVLLEIKQHKNAIRNNDDEDNVNAGENGASFDADADVDDNDGYRNNNNKKQKESDDTK